MATCVAGMSASAATATRTFYAGTKAVTASVSLGYASYYGASTSCNNSSVTDRYVSLEGYVSGGGTVSDYGYSKNGTASAFCYYWFDIWKWIFVTTAQITGQAADILR